MTYHSIREWGHLNISEGGRDNTITRGQADRLLAVARKAQASLRTGESYSQRILIEGVRSLHAQQVVGIVAAPGVSLEILPKIDGLDDGNTRSNLIRMLARVLHLTIAHGDLTPLGWQSHDLLEILIGLFCDRLFEAIHRGFPRRYALKEGDITALRGRLDAKRQFTVLATSPQRLACRYNELSANIAINQILKSAVSHLRHFSRAAENQRRLVELEFAFADVATIPRERLPWDQLIRELDRTNTAFHDLLSIAKLLLGDRFQTTSAGVAPGWSLLFEMNTLFEEYMGRILQQVFKDTEFRVTLQKPQRYALFDIAANESRFKTKPDIVVSFNGKPIMIIDTKWKRLARLIDDPKHGVSQSDVYQMIAYAQVYQVGQLLLLYPHHSELGVEEGILSKNKIIGTEHSCLRIGTISLKDLDCLPSKVRSLVSNILHGMQLPSAKSDEHLPKLANAVFDC
jgi:5-methylcytosine-specific restriction enzyme subunit McrC